MRRRLFNLMTAASLLLCAAVIVLWVRSRVVFDWIFTDPYPGAFVASGGGELALYYRSGALAAGPTSWTGWGYHREKTVPAGMLLDTRIRQGAPQSLTMAALGGELHIERLGPAPVHNILAAIVPYWMPAAGTAVLPGVFLVRRLRRRHRRGDGTCPACGYDLRATPERCPECGTEPAARALRSVTA